MATDGLEPIRQFWDQHARRDPWWAILSDAEKRDGKWDVTRFFETGVQELAALLYDLDAQGIAVNRGAALDFGCGVGRLTQALAPHFARAVGVDISDRMLALAAQLNRFPHSVSYVCNQAADLRVFDDGAFDFVVSNIVLQHLPPALAMAYLREFLRVLAPAGILVFQLPSHQRRPENRAPISVAMPDQAYRASFVVSGVPDAVVNPSDEITLEVDVTNGSAIDWARRRFGVIRVGNHWLDAAGRMLARDDGRSSLPASLGPGGTCRVTLTIKAPQDAGEYQCEIDLAHEGILWFRDHGSPVARFGVRVGVRAEGHAGLATHVVAAAGEPSEPAPAGTPAGAEDPGAFPMHGVPVNSVVSLIAERGGTLLHIENDRSCGDDWVSYSTSFGIEPRRRPPDRQPPPDVFRLVTEARRESPVR